MSRFLDPRWDTMETYVPGEQPQEELVKLNTNESPFPPAPGVRALFREQADLLADELRLYPDPSAKALKQSMKAAFPEAPAFFFGNGSDEVLATVFQAYATGRRVYYPQVSYGFYPVYAEVHGADAVEVPLARDRILPEDYAANDGMVLIANPNAPTGLALELQEIEQILQNNPDHPVVIDEAYVDFGAQSALALLSSYQNLIVIQTFSKSRSLAGLRFGFAAGSPELMDDLHRLQFGRNPYPISRLTARIVTETLKDPAYFDTCRFTIIENRANAVKGLRERGFEVSDSMANFLWVRPTDRPAEEYFKKLRERKILVRFFSKDSLKDRLRITVGTKEQMDLLLAAISAIQRSPHDEN